MSQAGRAAPQRPSMAPELSGKRHPPLRTNHCVEELSIQGGQRDIPIWADLSRALAVGYAMDGGHDHGSLCFWLGCLFRPGYSQPVPPGEAGRVIVQTWGYQRHRWKIPVSGSRSGFDRLRPGASSVWALGADPGPGSGERSSLSFFQALDQRVIHGDLEALSGTGWPAASMILRIWWPMSRQPPGRPVIRSGAWSPSLP